MNLAPLAEIKLLCRVFLAVCEKKNKMDLTRMGKRRYVSMGGGKREMRKCRESGKINERMRGGGEGGRVGKRGGSLH